MTALAEALETNTALTTLNLRNSNIGDAGAAVVGAAAARRPPAVASS